MIRPRGYFYLNDPAEVYAPAAFVQLEQVTRQLQADFRKTRQSERKAYAFLDTLGRKLNVVSTVLRTTQTNAALSMDRGLLQRLLEYPTVPRAPKARVEPPAYISFRLGFKENPRFGIVEAHEYDRLVAAQFKAWLDDTKAKQKGKSWRDDPTRKPQGDPVAQMTAALAKLRNADEPPPAPRPALKRPQFCPVPPDTTMDYEGWWEPFRAR